MTRTVIFPLAALAAWMAGGETLLAQWPAYTTGLADPHAIQRGPGFNLAIYKLLLLLPPFWAWVKSADWVSRDTAERGEAIGLPAEIWNPVMVFSFLLVFMTLLIEIPFFLAGYALVLLAYVVPFAIYVVLRNGKVSAEERVFTPEHLKNWFANLGKGGGQREVETKHAWQLGPPVELVAVGPLQMENQQAVIESRQSPAFVSVKILLADALGQRADKIMLDYTKDGVACRYQIDGVWHNANPQVRELKKGDPGPVLNREIGDQMLAVLKRISHLKMTERRAKQEGKFKIEFGGAKYDASLVSQGTPTGERAILTTAVITKTVRSLEDLGMRDKLREQLKELIGPGAKGIVIFATLPGDGLSATWQAALRSTDRLMRDFISVEDVAKREPEVENVDVQKLKVAEGETPEGLIPKLILKQPEVICIPEVASGQALSILCDWIVDEDKLSIVSTRGKEAADALLRVLALRPGDKFPQVVKAVVYSRLIRKLCESCREAVQPTPELLQRLGIPAGRVQVLYREKQPLPPGVEPPKPKKGDPPLICPACNGLGYKGRTAIFEILVIDDKQRQILAKQPKLELLKQAARAAGNRSLQEEGILLVALGTTSLTELQRILKQ
ncbi:MAG: ATPase, T2SS/T4P/T4SS family [Pirellulaceae bacterium]|nr:ATPase, T2SS/T4P/T4SS family [Pirellulaceae bacterium]